MKAYRKGARIIIIEDEFDGVSQTDIIKFGKIIRRLIQRKLGVIVNSNSNLLCRNCLINSLYLIEDML